MKKFKLPTSHNHCDCGCKEIKHNHSEVSKCDCGCTCTASPCECGCADGAECNCGCNDGKDCDCDSPEHRRSQLEEKLKKEIVHNHCDCGCKEIKHNHSEVSKCDCSCTCNATPCECDCANGNECNCGCNNGKDCDCDSHEHRRSQLEEKLKKEIVHNHCECDCLKNRDCTSHKNKTKQVKNNLQDNDSTCGCQKCSDMTTVTAPFNKMKLLRSAIQIVLSVTLLSLGLLLDLPKYYNLIFIIPSLLIIGGEYIFRAIKNLIKGKIFDENLLMSIAAIGALFIGEYFEGIAVMVLYTIGETLQELAVTKSKKNISDLLSLKTQFANKLIGDMLIKIDSNDIVIGDTLVVTNGERIPTDGIILSGTGTIDTSMLSGEYKPVMMREGDTAPCGAIVQGKSITIKVTKLFKDTTAARIMDLVSNASEKKPKSQQFITKFAKYYTPIVVMIALIVAIIPPLAMGFNQYFSEYLHKALLFLVISCPCALVISVPLGYFAGIGGAARKGILFKGGNYVEALNTVDTIVLDKTGTLTEGVFEVEDIVENSSSSMSLMTYAAYAESRSNHPIARSIMKYYNNSVDQNKISNYTEIDGMGISLTIDSDNILCGKAELLENNEIPTATINTSSTVIHIACNGNYLGYITINDKIKKGAKELINKLQRLGKNLIIMSGDRELSVKKVAQTLGVNEYYHSLLPQDKAELVEKLINSGKKVAFVGDGLNDAPVLKLATVGICIGGINNDASIEAADIVLSGNDITSLYEAFYSSRKTRNIVGQNIALSIATKIIIMAISLTVAPLMWLALVADVGISLIAVLNSLRAMRRNKRQ